MAKFSFSGGCRRSEALCPVDLKRQIVLLIAAKWVPQKEPWVLERFLRNPRGRQAALAFDARIDPSGFYTIELHELKNFGRIARFTSTAGGTIGRTEGSAQFARRLLLIRKVTTTPSSDQSKAMVPPSWAAILRCTNLLPKPCSLTGAMTGGPPRSVHITTTSSS